LRLTKTPYRLPGIGDICFVTNADSDDAYLQFTRNKFHIYPEIRLCLDAVAAGEQFVDIGANIGHFTLPLGKKGARVLAVEAMPETAQLLELGVRESGLTNVVVVQAAITDRQGTVNMANTGAWAQIAVSGRGIEVPATTLPQLTAAHGFDRPRFIKVDTEGSEFDILSAARDWLADRLECELLLEFNSWTWHRFGRTANQGMQLLSALGYRMFMLDGNRLVQKHVGDCLEHCVAELFATRGPERRAYNGCAVATLSASQSLEILRRELTISVHHRRHAAIVLAEHWDKFSALEGVRDIVAALLADAHEVVRKGAEQLRSIAG